MIFDEQVARKPDHYPKAQRFIDAMWASHWTPNEFSFTSDLQDFSTRLNPLEKQVVINTLSAIGQIEIAVKKFWAKLGDNLPHPSLTDLGYVMANVEVIHNQAYEKLLRVLGMEDVFQENLKNAVVAGRVKYLRKYLHRYYMDSRQQYVYSLILFTLFVENVSLFSQFYTILYFNRFKGILKDTAQQIQYTKNEELLHAQAGVWLVREIRNEHPELFDQGLVDLVVDQARKAYAAEAKVVDWMLGDFAEPQLNPKVLKEFIKQRLNESIQDLDFPPAFEVDSEIARNFQWFEEELLAPAMTDFFHKRPVDYAKSTQTFNPEDFF